MSIEHLQRQLAEAWQTIQALEEELLETNRGLMALTLELEQRVDERTKELQAAHTALQQSNADLLELTEALQTANRELEAFSYSVSHDLRAPLRSINGYSQLLLEDCHDHLDDRGKHYLRRMREACQHMAQLIEDMLSLSGVMHSEMRLETVDLTALAKSISATLQLSAPERQAEFIIAEGLLATGDPGLLRVALENLLGNAWKFTGKVPRPRIEFGCAATPPVYFVRDNGAGFNMDQANKLFGVFQRLHSEDEFPGTGIGLATVQRIMHRHGGRVWAQGALGRGATFFFTLR